MITLKTIKYIKQAFEELSDEENEDRLFNTQYTTEEEAKQLLQNGDITGYMILNEDTSKVVVATSGINETILKYVTEEITQTTKYYEYTCRRRNKKKKK